MRRNQIMDFYISAFKEKVQKHAKINREPYKKWHTHKKSLKTVYAWQNGPNTESKLLILHILSLKRSFVITLATEGEKGHYNNLQVLSMWVLVCACVIKHVHTYEYIHDYNVLIDSFYLFFIMLNNFGSISLLFILSQEHHGQKDGIGSFLHLD